MNVSDDEKRSSQTQVSQFAVIGMAGRFPGARNVEQFWANVRDGVESIRRLSDEELIAAGASRAEIEDAHYVKACPVLDDVGKFDARFFGFSPRDASVMDPAQRFFLEVAWEALEHSGYTGLPEEATVGVFGGSGAPLYMMENLRTRPELMRSMGDFLVRHTGNDMNFMATRVSYEMDLRGPSINIQTACSSALVSVHVACQSLSQGECDMAIAGGSTVLVPHGRGYLYREGEIMSPDGHCRPFDAKSAGTVFGSGTGCVVLKRLEAALDDGDTIHAVIRGTAINNDGAVKVGYLAPGVDGQASVIRRAFEVAGVPADSITYVETHGTGTLVGDPIEVEALNQAFRSHTSRTHYCAIGSVKSNIGHLGEAAGAASLIKAIFALKHRQLPPSLGFERANPAIDFEDSPFYVNDQLRTWDSQGPRRCGVTALGAGGTNCHVILEEAPEPLEGEGARPRQLLVISAKTRAALDRAAENLASALEQDESAELADVAYTLAVGRRPMPFRRAVGAAAAKEASALLRDSSHSRVVTAHADEGKPKKLVFSFPGGGAQYARMGADLYENEEVFHDAIDACLERLGSGLGRTLRHALFEDGDLAAATRRLERPSLTLPALFAAEYALAKLLGAWGLRPAALVGHSMGEYTAACLAGVMTLEEALQLVTLRGRLFESVGRGGMLSVPLAEAALRKLMPPDLSVAAVNAPELTVASGPAGSIDALERTLADGDVDFSRVHIDVAAHSAMLDSILGEFRALCRRIDWQPPQVPMASNLTGRWLSPEEATDPEYWVRHLRSTVRFAECVESVSSLGDCVWLEVGPGRTLSMLARAQRTPVRSAFNTMRHSQEQAADLDYALTALGRVWASGVEVDWSAFYDGQLRNRIPLPTYPFERESFWVDPGRQAQTAESTELVKRPELGDWFQSLSWARAPLIREAGRDLSESWLILAHDARAARTLARALARAGSGRVIVAVPGWRVERASADVYKLDFRSLEQYDALLEALEEAGELPSRFVYLAGRSRRLPGVSDARPLELEQALVQHFFAPTHFVRALGERLESVDLTVLTSGLCDHANMGVDPLRSLVLGPVLVAPRELAQARVRCVDMGAWGLSSRGPRLDALVEELRAGARERVVALRDDGRWSPQLLPLPLPAIETAARPWLREGGVYLITGGLGGIGLEIAKHFASTGRVKLVLLSRTALPPEAEWERLGASLPPDSAAAKRLRAVVQLRDLGADVLVLSADVADAGQMRAALAEARTRFGSFTGVVHAAGVMDDAPLLTKSAEAMRRVLSPKVQGTLVLDELLNEELDFFVLFSSVASYLGLPGQVDYTAANAFLDAFAGARSRSAAGRTLVINWNAWQQVGMAQTAYRAETGGLSHGLPCEHPALDGYVDQAGGRLFSTDFSLERHWLLSEHRIRGSLALLPGTAFVELARAAFAAWSGAGAVELLGLTFLSPFQVDGNETLRLCVRLTGTAQGCEIAMYSGMEPQEAIHVLGEARAYTGPPPADLRVEEVSARCALRVEEPVDGFLDQDFVDFGPRWANIRRVAFGEDEALLELELGSEFHGDLTAYGLHPALLDMATGGAQALIPAVDLSVDFYVPVRYGAVRVLGPMPGRVFSHVRCTPDSGRGMAYFDVTLADGDGRVFAEVAGFAMKRLDRDSALTASRGEGLTRAERLRAQSLEAILREAITPAEGLEAFDRVMAQPHLVQVVASSVDLARWERKLAAEALDAAQPHDPSAAAGGFARPELLTEYKAPSSHTEVTLAEIWSALLGVDRVGVCDDFFDIGGNSLVAVRLFSAVKKRLGVSLPLATLFDSPTIESLAAVVDEKLGRAKLASAAQAEAGDSQPVASSEPTCAPRSTVSDEYDPLVPIQVAQGVPFFCVHGAGGNVLNFQALAKRLGADQSFYGLQARGVTGGEPEESIEAMAARYVAAVRALWPAGPYLLGGYSGGGVVAYEMAQRLRAAGQRVSLLAFLDTFHPAVRPLPLSRESHLSSLLAEGPSYLVRRVESRLRRRLEAVSSDTQINYYQMRARPMPFALREAYLTRAFDRAARNYVPTRYDGPVTLFRARTPEVVFSHAGPRLGWTEISQLEVVEVPGNHDSLMREPNVGVLLTHLKERIVRASQ